MKVLIVILSVLAITFTTSIQSDLSTYLNEYKENPFQQSMLGFIQMNTDLGSPLHELVHLLEQIRDELNAITEVCSQEWQTQQRRCEVDESRLSAMLAQAQTDLNNQRNQQASLNQEMSILEKRLKEDTNSLVRNAKAIADAQSRLDFENSDYTSKWNDYSEAILACKEAQRLLINMNTGSLFIQLTKDTKSSLIQTRDRMQQIRNLLEPHALQSSVALFQPVMEALLELNTNTSINQEILHKVLNLIERLIAVLLDGQDFLESNHTTKVLILIQQKQQKTNLENLLADLNNEKNTLENAITNANNRLIEIKSRLNQLDRLINVSNAIVDACVANLTDAQDSCVRQEADFNLQQVSRSSEIDIVDRLITFVKDRIANQNGQQ